MSALPWERQAREVALQAADVALLSEDMERLAAAHRLARRTAQVIRQNLVFAIGAMVVLVIGAAFFELPLPLAVVGHEGGTVLVVLNGLRLLSDPIRNMQRSVADRQAIEQEGKGELSPGTYRTQPQTHGDQR